MHRGPATSTSSPHVCIWKVWASAANRRPRFALGMPGNPAGGTEPSKNLNLTVPTDATLMEIPYLTRAFPGSTASLLLIVAPTKIDPILCNRSLIGLQAVLFLTTLPQSAGSRTRLHQFSPKCQTRYAGLCTMSSSPERRAGKRPRELRYAIPIYTI